MGRRFFSIGLKLALTTMTMVAVLTACVDLTLSRYEARNLMASKEAAASMVARLLVASAVAPLTFADEKGVQDVVELLAANDDIVHASAWSVTEDARGLGKRVGELRRGGYVDPPTTIPPALRVRRTDAALIVEAPVADPTGKIVGVVQAAFSLAHEQAALLAMERRVLGASIGGSFFLTVLLLLVARFMIVKPLARLVDAANALERGKESHVAVGANDEIGKLATAFVSMASAIEQRERRIAERNKDMRRVLDNVEDGFLAVTPDGALSEERSRIIDDWFGAPAPGATLFDYVEQIAGVDVRERLRLGWESIADDFLPIELTVDQLLGAFDRQGRSYSVTYRPICDSDGKLLAMLMVIRDVTRRVELERAEQKQRELMVIFKHVLSDRGGLDEFLADSRRLVASIEQGDALDLVTYKRQIHTLKGNSAIFGLQSIARCCHELESTMLDEGVRPTQAQIAALRSLLDDVAATCAELGGNSAARIVIDEDEHRGLLRAIRGGADARELAAVVTSFRHERAATRMVAIGEQLKQLAQRLGKGAVDIHVEPSKLRLPSVHWAPFWSVFGHVVRNAVDHGLESPATRRSLGKPEHGVVRMSFEENEERVIFRFADDGAGIDWSRLADKARDRGLPAETRQDLEDALFTDAVSTRDEATETSGRGVGMGAVRQCVEACGGSIRIEGDRGLGTGWVFCFPRTMLTAADGRTSGLPPPRALTTAA